jgi:hypothetical protein
MPTTRTPLPKILPDTRTHAVLAFLGSMSRATTMLAANTGIGTAVFGFWRGVPWLLSVWPAFQMRIRPSAPSHPIRTSVRAALLRDHSLKTIRSAVRARATAAFANRGFLWLQTRHA